MKNATEPQTLATVSVAFKRDGEATFEFKVEKGIDLPTSQDLQVIAFAKIFSELVSSIASSEAMSEIAGLVRYVSEESNDA